MARVDTVLERRTKDMSDGSDGCTETHSPHFDRLSEELLRGRLKSPRSEDCVCCGGATSRTLDHRCIFRDSASNDSMSLQRSLLVPLTELGRGMFVGAARMSQGEQPPTSYLQI